MMMHEAELFQEMLAMSLDGIRLVEWAEPWMDDPRFDCCDTLDVMLLVADKVRSGRMMGDLLRDVGEGNVVSYVGALKRQALRGGYPFKDVRRSA
jgi:hypothetical protein